MLIIYFEEGEHLTSSDGFFELERLPERALVLGAGYIATELAGMLHELVRLLLNL